MLKLEIIKTLPKAALPKFCILQYPIISYLQSSSSQALRQKNLYETLQVNPQSSFNEIKKQYRELSKIYHPDYYKGNDNKFHDIQKAYKILSEIKTRKQHDLNLGIQKSVWESQQYKLNSDQFQNEIFNNVLNSQQKIIHLNLTLEQRLQKKFEKQINEELKISQKYKGFIFPMLGFGLFWMIWSTLQYIILNYKGNESYSIKSYSNDKKLSSIPLNFR